MAIKSYNHLTASRAQDDYPTCLYNRNILTSIICIIDVCIIEKQTTWYGAEQAR